MTNEQAIKILDVKMQEGYLKNIIRTVCQQRISDLEAEAALKRKSIDEATQFLISELQ